MNNYFSIKFVCRSSVLNSTDISQVVPFGRTDAPIYLFSKWVRLKTDIYKPSHSGLENREMRNHRIFTSLYLFSFLFFITCMGPHFELLPPIFSVSKDMHTDSTKGCNMIPFPQENVKLLL